MIAVCAHILVCGLVQGVGFRYFAQRSARRIGLVGYVRNVCNGDVEVEVEGERGLVSEFIEDLRIGPASSHVTNINVQWHNVKEEFKDFSIRF
ncbi:acylphosphatase [bacterium]|nr:acylphosphatase [bacterium]